MDVIRFTFAAMLLGVCGCAASSDTMQNPFDQSTAMNPDSATVNFGQVVESSERSLAVRSEMIGSTPGFPEQPSPIIQPGFPEAGPVVFPHTFPAGNNGITMY